MCVIIFINSIFLDIGRTQFTFIRFHSMDACAHFLTFILQADVYWNYLIVFTGLTQFDCKWPKREVFPLATRCRHI